MSEVHFYIYRLLTCSLEDVIMKEMTGVHFFGNEWNEGRRIHALINMQ